MTLIKMYFVSTVRKLTAEVAEKMAGKVSRLYAARASSLHTLTLPTFQSQELSETALHALLYAKFSSTASSLRILIFELEKRGRLEPTEYAALLQECYTVWFASRGSLLAAPLAEEVRRMDPGSTDLIKLVSRSWSALLFEYAR